MLSLIAILATLPGVVAQKAKPQAQPVNQTGAKPTVSSATVSDYFPLQEGSEYQYEDKIGKQKYGAVCKVGTPTTFDGVSVTPMVIDDGSAKPEITYYTIDKTTVRLYTRTRVPQKDEKGQPVMVDDQPQYTVDVSTPIMIKLPEAGGQWSSVGKTVLIGGAVSLSLRGTSQYVGEREVMGAKRQVLMVTLDEIAGADSGPPITSHLECYYAKGVGLFQMKDKNTIGKRSQERLRTLISYSPGRGQ